MKKDRKLLTNSKNALARVKKHFPNVTRVVDSKKSVVVQVLPKDTKEGKRKNPNECALAKACRRKFNCDGVIIGIGTSYLIKKNVAIRFLTTDSVAREITSFDRHREFAPGNDYRLSRVSPSVRMRAVHSGPTPKKKKTKTAAHDLIHRHRTAGIRVL